MIYTNDLNFSIRYCLVHHFADDTNLLNYNNSVKRTSKKINQDLKNLTNWTNANKICLNVSKTEVVLFKSSRKLTEENLNKKIYPANFTLQTVKYLGINIDENLNWKQEISDIAITLRQMVSYLN